MLSALGVPPVVRQILTVAIPLVGVPLVIYQVRKPSRWFGKPFARAMNVSHSALTDWGLRHVAVGRWFTCLDVGCGGGRTVQKLAEAANEGKVCGVDYAAGSVAVARETNAALIQDGRVEIRQASVSKLPYPDAMFDLVTAVETHYYWPDLPNDLREVFRVTKPEGTAIAIAELYKGGRNELASRIVMTPLGAKILSADEHRAWFTNAGFTDVQVDEERDEGWICVTGRKPAAGA